jgi:hypothetical protein
VIVCESVCSTSVDGAELKIASLPLRFLPCVVKTKRRSERDEYLPRGRRVRLAPWFDGTREMRGKGGIRGDAYRQCTCQRSWQAQAL